MQSLAVPALNFVIEYETALHVTSVGSNKQLTFFRNMPCKDNTVSVIKLYAFHTCTCAACDGNRVGSKTNAHSSLRHKQDAAVGRCFAHVFDTHQPVALLQVDGGNAFHLCYVFGSLGTFDQSAAGIEEHLTDRKILIAYREKLFVLLKFENCGKVCRLCLRLGFGNIFNAQR